MIGSHMVAWFTVWEYVQQLMPETGSWPRAGTPSWAALDDDDPRKLAAVLEAGVHHALRIDAEQTVRAEASRDVSTAADWTAIAQRTRAGRGNAYIPRKAS